LTLAKLNDALIQVKNVQRLKCDIMDDYALLLLFTFINKLTSKKHTCHPGVFL